MNNVALIYSDDFKKLDFGHEHPMRGDRYRKALKEFKKLDLLDSLTYLGLQVGSWCYWQLRKYLE